MFYFRFQYALLSCSHESHPSSYSKSYSRLTLILFTCSDEHIGLRITYTAFVVSQFALPLFICPNYFAPEKAMHASGPKYCRVLASRFLNYHLILDEITDN